MADYGRVFMRILPDSDSFAADGNLRLIIPASQILFPTTSGVAVRFTAHVTQDTVIAHASIGPRDGSTANFASAPTELHFDGIDSVTIPAGTSIWSDYADLPIDDTQDYLIAIHVHNPFYYALYNSAYSGGGIYYDTHDDDDSQSQSVTGYSSILDQRHTLVSALRADDAANILWESLDLVSNNGSGGQWNYRTIISSALISGSATQIYFGFQANASYETILHGASIGLRSGTSEDFASAPTRITFEESNSLTMAAGTFAISDLISYSIDDSSDHLLHMYSNAPVTTWFPYATPASNVEYFKNTSDDDTLTQDIAYTGPQAVHRYIQEIVGLPITGPIPSQLMRHGTWFGSGAKQRMWWAR